MCVQEKEGWPVKLRDPLGAKLVSSWGGTSASGQRCWHPTALVKLYLDMEK